MSLFNHYTSSSKHFISLFEQFSVQPVFNMKLMIKILIPQLGSLAYKNMNGLIKIFQFYFSVAFLFAQDMPEKCKFTNLLCNESRLLKEDKIIILNIGNELRNRVAGGTFKYLNLQHDPVSDMNKLVRLF